jgi:hypothetical protein
MEPSRLADILAVLRDMGASAARFHASGELEAVTFGPPVGNANEPPDDGTEPAEEELPPGAFDPIARRRQLAKGK